MKKTSKKRNKPVSTQRTLKELLETEKRILVEGAFEAMNGGQALSPTWKHNIGDRVNFAGYSDGDDYAEVIDSLYDGKIYYLRCVAFSKRRNEEGLGTMSVHYVAAPWIKVRPLVSSKTDVPEIDVREQIENKLDFRQGSISSLLNMYYYHGINMNPFYQRDLVWDEKDKEDNYIRRERYAGTLSRSFYVGDAVSEEDIHAKYEDGILKLSLPKKAPKAVEEIDGYIAIEG